MADREITEYELARQWRESADLTLVQLSRLTGYSTRQILLFESGRTNTGDPITPAAWQRYRLVCAAVAANLDFDWRRVRQRKPAAQSSTPSAARGRAKG